MGYLNRAKIFYYCSSSFSLEWVLGTLGFEFFIVSYDACVYLARADTWCVYAKLCYVTLQYVPDL